MPLSTRRCGASTPRVHEIAVDSQASFDAFAAAHMALAGLDDEHHQLDDDQGFAFAPSFDPLTHDDNVVAASPTTRCTLATDIQDDLGLALQDQVELGRVNVVVSGREDSVDTIVNDRLYPALSTTSSRTHFAGRVGAICDTGSGIDPRVSYATSSDPILGTNGATQLPLKPGSGEQEEVGVRYRAPALPVTASLALFDLTRSDVLTTDPAAVTNTAQTGEERSRGIELSITATLAEALEAVATFTAYAIQNTTDLDATIVGEVSVG